MELRRWQDILGLKTQDGKVLGFNAHTLDVAELSEESWDGLLGLATSPEHQNALNDLETWNREPGHSVPQIVQKIRSISLNVTQICNLHCSYCAAGGDGTYGDPIKKISVEKTLPQIKMLLSQCQAGETFSINFLGGEPLLYPEGVQTISEYALDLAALMGVKLKLSVTTNGTMFSEYVVRMLSHLAMRITISIDGAKELNDQRRPSKDKKSTTDKILAGFELLRKYRSQLGPISVNGVFGKDNMAVEDAWEFYQTLPIDRIDLAYDHDETQPELSRQFMYGMERVFARAYEKGGERELRRIHFADQVFSNLDERTPVRHYCGSGQTFLMIDAKNQIFTCPWDVGIEEEKVGESTYLSASRLAPYQDPLVEKNNCQSCWARNLCGGGCMYIHKKTTGSKNQVAPAFCERTRYLISLAISYYVKSRSS